MAKQVGTKCCSECGALSPVLKDKFKYTVPCPDKETCGVSTYYQTKAAKARIEKYLEAEKAETMPEPEQVKVADKKPEPEETQKPEQKPEPEHESAPHDDGGFLWYQ